ncbi:MAG: glutamyl-tRNA reductase [Gammaproteobacteria bacterium]|nr:glutamyl-tRNA reductase [Gammaproteobacteria bacterium]
MPVVTLGLNHKTAPVPVRERVVISTDRLDAALRALAQRPGVCEAAVISTCNRTEIHAVLSPEATPAILQRWLETEQGLEPGWLTPYLYVHEGRDAIRHLLRVGAGLDSLVLGEPQILGQAKLAYHSAARAGLLGQILQRLFQHAFAVAKRVRTETDIGAYPVSVAFAAVTLARQIFGGLESSAALLIGAGEMIELTARHFHEQPVKELFIANRSQERAERLAMLHTGTALTLDQIPSHLARVDIVVSCTASEQAVVELNAVKDALKHRRRRPIFMVDLAVPRDIEPAIEQLDDVFLYSIDDLRGVVERNMQSRAEAAEAAEGLVETQTDRFMDWVRTLDAVSTIRRFRQHGERERELALEQARRSLAAGQPPERVLEVLAHRLTRKLLHVPTVGLRQAARTGDPAIVQQSRWLLGLEDSDEKDKE